MYVDFFQVRVGTEGINGTIGGTVTATNIYVEAMISHSLFKMDREDFKVRKRQRCILWVSYSVSVFIKPCILMEHFIHKCFCADE